MIDLVKFFETIRKSSPIDVSQWKYFDIDEIFCVHTGASMPKNKLEKGTTPRITVTALNNGIGGKYQDSKCKEYRVYENFISYSFLRTCFYHPYKASVDMKVHVLQPKSITFNPYIGLFVVAVLRKAKDPGDYNDQISKEILEKMKIKLPVDSSGNPDWQFMEDYVKSLPYSSNL